MAVFLQLINQMDYFQMFFLLSLKTEPVELNRSWEG